MTTPLATEQDLWGDLPIPGGLRTPADMLREQAEALADKTKDILVGSLDPVPSLSNGSNVCIRFIVQAPALEYRTSIFEVEHDAATAYPCIVRRTLAEDYRKGGGFNVIKPVKATSELELVNVVKNILQSPEVRKLIAGLLETSRITEERSPQEMRNL